MALSPQAHAMIEELVRMGVHGDSFAAVCDTLVLDQLKYLSATPGFRTLVDVAYDAARAIETKRRQAKPDLIA